MDRLSSRNYFVVVVAGMFCLLSASVVSAQTATNLNCNGCVQWGEYDPGIRTRFFQQEANIAQNSSDVAASFGTLIVGTISAASDISSGVASVDCPVDALASSANCHCDNAGGTRNFGVLFFCQVAGNGGVVGCFSDGLTFNPGLPTPEGNITLSCLSGLTNDGTALLPPVPVVLSIPGEQKYIIGTSSNQKSLPSSGTITSDKNAELDAILMSVQDQALDHSTALQERQRQKSN